MLVRVLIVAIFCSAAQLLPAQEASSSSPLEFNSSIPWLTQSFTWAKGQALAYSRSGTKDMGPWYEAALPGRNAFCMRDVSHQVEGGAALGLSSANRNMLTRFAQSAAKSRDWAAYWEIDGEGNPSSADYVSDNDFWFNLPANFDVFDAAVRAWRWTGDSTYLQSPVWQQFFRLTMTDYLESWQLEPATILSRPRIANRRQQEGKFVNSRGIPSYVEGTKDFTVGTDLLAAEYRAMLSFSQVTPDRALAQKTQQEATQIQALLEKTGWSERDNHYYGILRKDRSGSGSGDTLVLYFGAAKDPQHRRGALNYISAPKYWKEINIEEETYVPLTLFRYGRSETAYQVLANISAPEKPRREYPEVSYSVIEAIVSGVMGLTPGGASDGYDISTISRLPTSSDSAHLKAVPIKQNQIEISHTGTSESKLTNSQGPRLRWRAEFPGTIEKLTVDGRVVPAQHATNAEGLPISWTDVLVEPGKSSQVKR